jgi:hypothetical protein
VEKQQNLIKTKTNTKARQCHSSALMAWNSIPSN